VSDVEILYAEMALLSAIILTLIWGPTMFKWLFGDRAQKAELAAKRKSEERFRALETELEAIRSEYAHRLHKLGAETNAADAEFEAAHAAIMARYRSES
jgi:hypothetical protein